MKLNFHDQSSKVQSMMKKTHDNDVTNHTSAVYAENKIELL